MEWVLEKGRFTRSPGMKALTPNLVPVVLALVSQTAFAATTRYVDLNSPNPTPPYTTWGTASTNIQVAIDAAVSGDVVLVTNGLYRTGGRAVFGTMTNRVVVDKPVQIQSVNGPQFTFIEGYQVPVTTNGDGAVRCVYVTNGALLDGFTLTNGATRNVGDFYRERNGGGVWCESAAAVSNCISVHNSASGGGGGVYSGTLNDCVLAYNVAGSYGGGASESTLNNCIVTHNSAGQASGGAGGVLNNCLVAYNSSGRLAGGGVGTFYNCTIASNTAVYEGGGVYESTLKNCIAYNNSAPNGPNHIYSSLSYSCTKPLPTGPNNFTNEPIFIDQIGGNFRLQASSPCINSGLNTSAPAGPDLDGNPRIAGGTVDIGAYEFQAPASILSYAWAQQNGLPTDGSADFTDADGDGMNNYGEWRSDTNPTNSLSSLRMVNATNSPTGAEVTWQSVSTRNYWLERATNLGLASPFQTIATNIVGVAGVKSFTDPSATNAGPYFYRVGVQ